MSNFILGAIVATLACLGIFFHVAWYWFVIVGLIGLFALLLSKLDSGWY